MDKISIPHELTILYLSKDNVISSISTPEDIAKTYLETKVKIISILEKEVNRQKNNPQRQHGKISNGIEF